jgi:hypothetical protein
MKLTNGTRGLDKKEMTLTTQACISAIGLGLSKPIKNLLILAFLLLAFQSVAAISVYADSASQKENLRKVKVVYSSGKFSVEDKVDYKLKKANFEEQYAFNDTAKAVIRLFFQKRMAALTIAAAMGVPLALVRAAGTQDTRTVSLRGGVTTSRQYGSSVVPLLVVIGTAEIYAFSKASRFSRKRLLETLIDYERNRALPASLIKQMKLTHFKE